MKILVTGGAGFIGSHVVDAFVKHGHDVVILDNLSTGKEINIIGSLNLIEAARKIGIKKFIYISTGGATYGEPEYIPAKEDHPINPVCPYGVSKHTVEHYLSLYSKNYGLTYTTLRYPNVYGPRQDPKGEAGVVAIFSLQMLKGIKPTIFG